MTVFRIEQPELFGDLVEAGLGKDPELEEDPRHGQRLVHLLLHGGQGGSQADIFQDKVFEATIRRMLSILYFDVVLLS